jgi:hypothetical protein
MGLLHQLPEEVSFTSDCSLFEYRLRREGEHFSEETSEKHASQQSSVVCLMEAKVVSAVFSVCIAVIGSKNARKEGKSLLISLHTFVRESHRIVRQISVH